ncbi:MAG TPA: carboxypeptidase-like regulatory domain-containing protein [Terracidiphilus sp.]
MGKFGSWLAGILGSIIVGVGIYYFTKPKPTPLPPPTPVVTTLEGMVYSGSTPVPRAMVAVDLKGADPNGPIHQVTDENGSYRFEFPGLPTDATAMLQVTANGYQQAEPKSLGSPLATDIRLDFPLIPTPVAAPTGVGAGVVAARPMRPGEIRIPAYVRKGVAQTVQVRIPQKH